MKMRGQLTEDTVVEVPANVVWEVYRGLEIGRMVDQLLPDVLGKVEVVEGDGSVGTIVKVTYPPGAHGDGGYMKEKFTKIDDEKRIKETEVIEGRYKDLGFDLFKVRYEIVGKDGKSTIIRSTVEYEIDDKLTDTASLVTTKKLELMAEVIGKYLAEKSA